MDAMNALLFHGYGLTVAISTTSTSSLAAAPRRPQPIDRILITSPDSESYIVDLDPDSLIPSSRSLLPFRTTSQIRSLATAAASDDSFHETKFDDAEINSEDVSLVMELLQRVRRSVSLGIIFKVNT